MKFNHETMMRLNVGIKMRRTAWPKGDYIVCTANGSNRYKDKNGNLYKLSIDDTRADDWHNMPLSFDDVVEPTHHGARFRRIAWPEKSKSLAVYKGDQFCIVDKKLRVLRRNISPGDKIARDWVRADGSDGP